MIYTCFEMIRDCQANRVAGWSYFITNYAPAVESLLRRYRPESRITDVLPAICKAESELFASLEPVAERLFLAELRQRVLDALDSIAPLAAPDVAIDLETLAAALEPLTVLEKQAVWLETMHYTSAEAGALLHTAPPTLEKIREKAAERIRAKADGWRTTLLAENGRQLGRQAAAGTGECLPAKAFLDLLDGRTTWRGREDLERHAGSCWHCIDHACRILEVAELLRHIRPLSEAEAEPLRKLLGIAPEKRGGWKRLFGAG
jgi:hypothetical protein